MNDRDRTARETPGLPMRAWRKLLRRLHILHLRLLDRRFDRRHGVDTRGFIELSKLSIDSPNKRLGYQ